MCQYSFKKNFAVQQVMRAGMLASETIFTSFYLGCQPLELLSEFGYPGRGELISKTGAAGTTNKGKLSLCWWENTLQHSSTNE